MSAEFYDPVDLTTYPLNQVRWCSEQGRPLMVSSLPGINSKQIHTKQRSIWRYTNALPIKIDQPVTLGEGQTPLIFKQYNKLGIHFKLEWTNPTGSFKDRGASMLVSYLKQLGIKSIIEDSSGNGGAAIAAYGKAAGMAVKIVAPASNSANKFLQSKAFGAQLELIDGPRIASQERAIELSDQYFYASHNWHPMFIQGTKTIGYEIWEDLGFKAPDNIIMPVGAGSNLLGCDIAFNELLQSGQINKLLRLFAVQPTNCSPLYSAFYGLTPTPVKPTIAEGTAIAAPIRLVQLLESLKRSNGAAVAINEADIKTGIKRLGSLSFYVEPTCASVCKAIEQLETSGTIKQGETTVVILTGSGLKAGDALAKIF